MLASPLHISNNFCYSLGVDLLRYVNDPSLWADYIAEHPGTTELTFTEDWPKMVASLNKVYNDWFKAAKQNGIIWVQAVSNDGMTRVGRAKQKVIVALNDGMPENRGRRDNELIQVSASFLDGTLFPYAGPVGMHVDGTLIQDENDPRLAGQTLASIDIYAPGTNVLTCNYADGSYESITGTSASTAQVVRDRPWKSC